jgi:threonine synthase
MITQTGKNTHVFAINGNFDDAQTGVKRIFNDAEFENELAGLGYRLSSANSINIGRLVPQVAYYVHACIKLLETGAIEEGQPFNVVVPTGNFGNILAAYYAKRMGLPIAKLICASNQNNVLTEFIKTGVYDANREFFTTNSPSMDILVSSNLERLVFEIADRDADLTKQRMDSLSKTGKYEITAKELSKLKKLFYPVSVNDAETLATITSNFDGDGYICDTHTATAVAAHEAYVEDTEDEETQTVILATAHPYKFADDVLGAISGKKETSQLNAMLKLKELSALEIPEEILFAVRAEPINKDVIDKDGIADYLLKFLAEPLEGAAKTKA